jgi:phosphoribosylaminoimidazolecarboxamide formyltransferase/IMP cyclohydrolase
MSIKVQTLLREDLEIKTALITVFDKTNIVALAHVLEIYGVNIISTGGTLKALQDVGIKAIPVTDVAPFPEMLDGRIKILQPQIFGGLLANKANPDHIQQITGKGIAPIDMVVCNFYPFEQVAAKEGVTGAELLDNIDIGGPTSVKSAAKNLGSVCVVTSPADYATIITAMKDNGGKIPYSIRLDLALKAFDTIAKYETAIKTTLSERLGKDPSTAVPAKLKSR